mmetsp:Transcript_16308/g.41544  ORF Transcript_16308/g.41544 Transcript_16308/m.41544 type:complete len:260 (-) Transcript_16308:88-867(-)
MRVVRRVVRALGVEFQAKHVGIGTSPVRELYGISSRASVHVDGNHAVRLRDGLKESLRLVLREQLRRHGEPRFVVKPNALVEAPEQLVSPLVVSLEVVASLGGRRLRRRRIPRRTSRPTVSPVRRARDIVVHFLPPSLSPLLRSLNFSAGSSIFASAKRQRQSKLGSLLCLPICRSLAFLRGHNTACRVHNLHHLHAQTHTHTHTHPLSPNSLTTQVPVQRIPPYFAFFAMVSKAFCFCSNVSMASSSSLFPTARITYV